MMPTSASSGRPAESPRDLMARSWTQVRGTTGQPDGETCQSWIDVLATGREASSAVRDRIGVL